MTSEVIKSSVSVVPGFAESFPPKDGFVSAATLMGETKTRLIFWDSAWAGGRGGWFDINFDAIDEKKIMFWEKRIKESPYYRDVSAFNEYLVLENEKKKQT